MEEALRLKNSVTGSVHIAAYNNVIRDWLPSILQQFHQKYPNIKVSIRQANDMQIKHWMESGEIDLAIVFNSYYNAASFYSPSPDSYGLLLLPRTMPLGTALV